MLLIFLFILFYPN